MPGMPEEVVTVFRRALIHSQLLPDEVCLNVGLVDQGLPKETDIKNSLGISITPEGSCIDGDKWTTRLDGLKLDPKITKLFEKIHEQILDCEKNEVDIPEETVKFFRDLSKAHSKLYDDEETLLKEVEKILAGFMEHMGIKERSE